MKPVKFPTRRRTIGSTLADLAQLIRQHDAAFACALLLVLFAVIGLTDFALTFFKVGMR